MPNMQHHYSLSYTHQPPQDAAASSSSAAAAAATLSSHIPTFDCTFHADLPASSPRCICRGQLAACPAPPSPSPSASASSSAIQLAGRHHRNCEPQAHDPAAFMQHFSAPVDVVRPCPWRSGREERWKMAGNGRSRRRRKDDEEESGAETMASTDEEEEEEEEQEEEEEEEQAMQKEEEEERLPPHEELDRQWAAATSCGGSAFSLCQGVGRTLKGRDLCRVRNAILKQTGFIS